MRRVCLGVLVFGVAVVLGMANTSLGAGGDEIAPAPLPPAVGALAQVADDSPPLQHNGGRWIGGEADGGRFWVRTDSLLWWTSGFHVPPLVTASPAGTPVYQAGVLGQPGTTILFGDRTVADDFQPGIRGALGTWLGSRHRWAVEADYLTLFQDGTLYDSGPRSDRQYLARPFFNVFPLSPPGPPGPPGPGGPPWPPRQDSQLVARPNEVSGRVTVDATDNLQSAGVWVRRSLLGPYGSEDDGWSSLSLRRLDVIAGYRFYRLGDEVTIREDQLWLDASPGPGLTVQAHDTFLAHNVFHGGEFGLATKFGRGRWSLDVETRVAIGNNERTITIDGGYTSTFNGSVNNYQGLLARYTNMGRYVSNDFVAIPQLNLDLGYQWNCHLRTYVGYNVLYWANVMRAGDQIDLNVDPNVAAPFGWNPARRFPAYPAQTTHFWAQGINLGGELRY